MLLVRMAKSSTDSSGGLILMAPALKLLLSSAPLSMYEVPASLAPPEVGDMSSPGLTEGAIKDRKSTRLNSSHRYISYAVLCLKKKTHILLLLVLATTSLDTLPFASSLLAIAPTLQVSAIISIFDSQSISLPRPVTVSVSTYLL